MIAGLSSFAIHILILLVMAAFTLSGTGGGGGGGVSIEAGNATMDSEAIDTVSIESPGEEVPSPASFSAEQISSSESGDRCHSSVGDNP